MLLRRHPAHRAGTRTRGGPGGAAIVLSAAALSAAACTASDGPTVERSERTDSSVMPTPAPAATTPTTEPPATRLELLTIPDRTVAVSAAEAPELALATSRALIARAPVVVVAPPVAPEPLTSAAALARQIGAPLLLAAEPTPAPPPTTRPAPTPPTTTRPTTATRANTTAARTTTNATTRTTTGSTSSVSETAPAQGATTAAGTAARTTTIAAPTTTVATSTTVDAATATGRELTGEIRRLGAHTVVAYDALPPVVSAALDGSVATISPEQAAALAPVERDTPPAGAIVLGEHGDLASTAALATVHAAGYPVLAVDRGDPRSPDARAALAQLRPTQVIAVGRRAVFPSAETVAGLVRTALEGSELPGGGQIMFPARRLVAIYGHPGDTNLGILGEQPVDASLNRAHQYAAAYKDVSPEPVVPVVEIITTVAAADPGADGDFSSESSVAELRPWIAAAAAKGVYVVLDLQPGYTDFLTQAQRFEEFLVQPHVGLALDPEWRLAPGQRHLQDIGSVNAKEVNATAAWLAGLVRDHALPQKLLVVHQFRLDMIRDRDRITVPPELALMFQMDGLGTQEQKLRTWAAVTVGGPAGAWFGWKNFHDEDLPLWSPADTVALKPSPLFISYQ